MLCVYFMYDFKYHCRLPTLANKCVHFIFYVHGLCLSLLMVNVEH